MENKNYDVQSVSINAPVGQVFEFVANPANLPIWTKAFQRANNERAVMVTPEGELSIKLEVRASEEQGTVDWYMYFPDGSKGTAYSRVTPNGKASVYTFVLMAPPMPLEQLEGAFGEQKKILAQELQNLAGQFA